MLLRAIYFCAISNVRIYKPQNAPNKKIVAELASWFFVEIGWACGVILALKVVSLARNRVNFGVGR